MDIPDLTAVALLRHLPLNTKRLLDFCMKVSLQRINFLNDQDSYQFLAINISCQFLANGHESLNFPVSLSVIELQIKFHLYVWIISYLAYSLKWTCWTESCGNALCWVVLVCIAWKYWEVLNDVRAQAEFSWCK